MYKPNQTNHPGRYKVLLSNTKAKFGVAISLFLKKGGVLVV